MTKSISLNSIQWLSRCLASEIPTCFVAFTAISFDLNVLSSLYVMLYYVYLFIVLQITGFWGTKLTELKCSVLKVIMAKSQKITCLTA